MNLVVVESPNKCAKIQSFLGTGYRVIASVGHIREIPPQAMNVDIENGFEPKLEVIRKKKDVVAKIKTEAEKAEIVYLASDPDREGAAIAYSIFCILPQKDQKKCLRITFNEITKKAVTDSLKDARPIQDSMPLIQAQKARQVLDRLVGYLASPLVWSYVVKGSSAGRVQSPALRMIVERQVEIDAFKPEDYWYIDATLSGSSKTAFQARVETKEKDNRYKDPKAVAEALGALKSASYTLGDIERKEKSTSPYPPFDTTSMQMACSSLFGWSATKTMSTAQDLYTSGEMTYLRTDSYNISKEAVDEVRDMIQSNFPSALPDKSRFYAKKSSASAQEAHEAIRPVHVNETHPAGVTGDALKLYGLIRARFIACQMSDMVVDTVVYKIKASTGHTLVARGQTIKDEGWHAVYPYSNVSDVFLPAVERGESLNFGGIADSKHATQPPPKYNDGSLVKKLEDEGIGRPATRASIIKGLQDKGYIDKGGKAFTPTDLGKRISNFLVPAFQDNFLDYKYTAGLEEDLDAIADGKKDYFGVVSSVYQVLKGKIVTAKATAPKKVATKMGATCPACKTGEVVEKESRFGKFFTCDNWPKCKVILVKKDGGGFTLKLSGVSSSTTEKAGRSCPDCGKDLLVRVNRKKGTKFIGCSGYPACKHAEKIAAEKKE